MIEYISKSDLVAEIKKREKRNILNEGAFEEDVDILSFINTLEVKEVDLLIHIIIAECCNWLAMNTNLSYDKIEGCRELMLIVKEEQFKAQKGE